MHEHCFNSFAWLCIKYYTAYYFPWDVRDRLPSFTIQVVTWNVPRLSSKSAYMDHSFNDLWTRLWTVSLWRKKKKNITNEYRYTECQLTWFNWQKPLGHYLVIVICFSWRHGCSSSHQIKGLLIVSTTSEKSK